MAIVIKELRIKVNIAEVSEDNSLSFQKFNPLKLQELKSEIVRECTLKVFEKIKEKAER
jgi:AMMECR1 domain-containing protein